MEQRKIRITKCSNPILWYKNYIGEIFTVDAEDLDVYWTRERDFFRSLNFILKIDCQLISKEN